ncbi:sensor domain-containing diguanylate cyclase [Chengkuizengella axinellae]|uniref:Diguanylate cyclase n=1 Tax=Chengkuizengella axinellae TaxID=3064388 RepID=A0ABT9IVD6_9BACL|nr:diguanylate cyclase [Chengkuizengella sp. 2205SS18-9]MDP5273325.1 diguanylate cyclase [Chengkuizengella sp. 2205SS18-9]
MNLNNSKYQFKKDSVGNIQEWDFSHNIEKLNVKHLRQIITDSFGELTDQIIADSLQMNGAFFVVDSNGKILNKYVFSECLYSERLVLKLSIDKIWSQTEVGMNAISDCISTLKPSLFSSKKHSNEMMMNYITCAVPISLSSKKEQTVILGAVLKKNEQLNELFLMKTFAMSLRTTMLKNIESYIHYNLYTDYLKVARENEQRKQLYQINKNLQSKKDAGLIISEVIQTIKDIYPKLDFQLFLSMDNKTNISFKTISFDIDEDVYCKRAFMQGKVQINQMEPNNMIIAVPLKGHQAVYGVFRIQTNLEPFGDKDIHFVSMIVDSAGIAFENAKLLEQSNSSVDELRLINDITRKLNKSLNLSEIFDYISTELINIFQADFGCILEFNKENNEIVVKSSNITNLPQEVFSINYGFSGIVNQTKEGLIVQDYEMNPTVSSKVMEITSSRSLIASPILVNDEVSGVVMFTNRLPNFFTYDNFRLLQVLSTHIGLAMSNATLHDEMNRMVITDNLTGLYARHYLDEQVKSSIQTTHQYGSLILIDIDFFKRVNDTYGHQLGDKILKKVSQIIQSCIRDSDIAARWGGEEIAVYIPEAQVKHALKIAERIRKRVYQETSPRVSVSCGVSDWSLSDNVVGVETLFYKADMALYEAKKMGRNQIQINT